MISKRALSLLFVTLCIFLVSLTSATCMDCCSDKGKCATAFRGSQGVCCGTRSVGAFMKPFCCPIGSDCIDGGSDGFKCRMVEERIVSTTNSATGVGVPQTQTIRTSTFNRNWLHLLWIIPLCIIGAMLLAWCVYSLVRHCLGETAGGWGSSSEDKTVIRIENIAQPAPVVHRHIAHTHARPVHNVRVAPSSSSGPSNVELH